MSLVALSVLACLAALGPAAGIHLQGGPEPALPTYSQDAADDGYRALGEDLLHGILDRYDPLVIEDWDFTLPPLAEITASGHVANLSITGLSGFKANKLSLQGSRIALDVALPSIAGVGMYNMTGTLQVPGFASLPLDGKGQLTFGLAGLKLDLAIELGISDKGQITLDECDVAWNMTDIKFQMNGLLGGAAIGSMINSILADALPHLVLKAYHDKLTEAATTAAAKWLPTIHQDHGPLPPLAARRQRRHAARPPLALEDVRALFADGGEDAGAEHSDEPVLLGQLLSSLLAERGDAEDVKDAVSPLARAVLASLGLERAGELDVRQLVSLERRGEPQLLEHGELAGELAGEQDGEQHGDGLLELLAGGLSFTLTGTTLHEHGALA